MGTAGEKGNNGANGADGISGYEIVDASTNSFTLTSGAVGVKDVDCPSGKVVVGGGCFTNKLLLTAVISGAKNLEGKTWQCSFRNDKSFAMSGTIITARAICATVNK